MSRIPNIVRSGWTICYETRFKNNPFIRSWGAYRGLVEVFDPITSIDLAATHEFTFWQEVDNDVLGRGGGRVRTVSTLQCTADYRPLHYRLQLVDTILSIDFGEKTFSAHLYDGSLIEGSLGETDFLLAGNMLPQLAIKVRLLKAIDPLVYNGAFFSPDTLQIVPYAIADDGLKLHTSFDEFLLLDAEGWISELVLPNQEVTVCRVKRDLPRWHDKKNVTTRKHEVHVYHPPQAGNARILDLIIPETNIELGATLALPPAGKKANAVAFFIGGSGRHDRHGFSNGLDLGYHQLLDRLAEAGIISLRFDKRGAGGTKLGSDILEFGFNQLVDEAQAALDYLYTRPEAQGLPTFLIGHSEGGLVALALASRTESVAGAVLLATAGRPLDQVVDEQLAHLAKDLELSQESLARWAEDQRAFFYAVRHIPQWTPETVSPKIYAERYLRRWYVELLAFDPLQLVTRLQCPLLILQGDADLQVSTHDAELIYSAAASNHLTVERAILHGYDHLFKRVGKKPGIRAYYDSRRKVGRAMLTTVERWILRVASNWKC